MPRPPAQAKPLPSRFRQSPRPCSIAASRVPNLNPWSSKSCCSAAPAPVPSLAKSLACPAASSAKRSTVFATSSRHDQVLLRHSRLHLPTHRSRIQASPAICVPLQFRRPRARRLRRLRRLDLPSVSAARAVQFGSIAARAVEHALQPSLISQIAQSLNDGRGLFLYGAPGNGKTSIAERVCSSFGQCVWIPQIITIHGELMRIYDPSCHEAVKSPQVDALKYDRRWVLIRRPTIIVGGELTLEYLETRFNTPLASPKRPLQFKSNCGTLVIDDFGRQRVSSARYSQSPDRSAREALRFPVSGQRPTNPGAVRRAARALHQPRAAKTCSTKRSSAASRTKSKSAIRPKFNSANC